jgi:hypothetical protein
VRAAVVGGVERELDPLALVGEEEHDRAGQLRRAAVGGSSVERGALPIEIARRRVVIDSPGAEMSSFSVVPPPPPSPHPAAIARPTRRQHTRMDDISSNHISSGDSDEGG